MADFRPAIELVLKNEGGYVNNPNDKGGETYKGIARKFHPHLKLWQVIDLTPDKSKLDSNKELHELCIEFYKDNFWMPMRLDRINDQRLANKIFDMAVNYGTKRVARGVQAIAGTLPDGVIGDKTIEAVNKMNAEVFVEKLINLSLSYRVYRCSVDKTQRGFLLGWVARDIDYDHAAATKLFKEVLRWAS